MIRRERAKIGPRSRIVNRFFEIHRPGRYPGWRSGLSAFPFPKEQWLSGQSARRPLFLREMAGTRDIRLPLRGQRRLARHL